MSSEPKKKGNKCNIAAFDMFGSPVAFNIRGDETYKTVIGCLWTFIMLFAVVAAFFWYFTIFVNKTDGEVTSTVETQDVYPKLDFHQTGFFLSLYATQDKKVLSINQLSDSFKIQATMHIETRDENDDASVAPTESTPLIVPFEPCVDAGKDSAQPNGADLKGKKGKAISNDALCSVSSAQKPLFVEGTDEDTTYAYFRIKIMPCDNTDPTCSYFYSDEGVFVWMKQAILAGTNLPDNGKYACSQMFSAIGKPVHKQNLALDPTSCDCGTYNPNNLKGKADPWTGGPNAVECNNLMLRIPNKIAEDTARTSFTLSYTEGSVTPDNYEEPFSFFLKTGAKIFGSVENTKLVNMYWKEVEVNTDKGLIIENIDTQTTLSLDSIIIDTLDRGTGKKKTEKTPNGISEPVAQSFIEFTLYSSNNKLIFERKYSKLVDVFANIGGISEVFGFVVLFCYAWYNGIRMEQKLLNYGVLNKKKSRDQEQKDNNLGNDDEVWEKKRHFRFGELVKFGLIEKGIGCCFKSEKMKKRQEFYEQVKESFEQRTDVINIMKGVSDVDTLKEALLAPYQLRLMHYLATKKDDDESNEEEMSVNKASKELNNKSKKLTPIQEQMDNYLRMNLPANVLSGNFEEPEEHEKSKMLKSRVVPIGMKTDESSHTLKVTPKEMNLMSPGLSPRELSIKKKNKSRRKSNSGVKIGSMLK